MSHTSGIIHHIWHYRVRLRESGQPIGRLRKTCKNAFPRTIPVSFGRLDTPIATESSSNVLSGNLGNDRVDQLAKKATYQDMNVSIFAPLSHWKHLAWERTVSALNSKFLASPKAFWIKKYFPIVYQRLKCFLNETSSMLLEEAIHFGMVVCLKHGPASLQLFFACLSRMGRTIISVHCQSLNAGIVLGMGANWDRAQGLDHSGNLSFSTQT
ncbi:hypothetical protein TNCV_4913441 [Trichonephila clavipes]|nr:hypothetical protein TNCV_4913441 [Trichonephila clavipes]